MELRKFKMRKSLNAEETDFFYAEITLDTQTKRVSDFSVIQIYQPNETPHQVKKHDCAHGFYHVHHYYLGMHAKIEESSEPITIGLFEQAKKDIFFNWSIYRERFIRKGLDT